MTSTARVGAGHARPAIAPPGAAIIGTTHHNALRGWRRAHHDAPLHTDHHAITNHAWHRTICPDTDRARRGRACPACHSSRAHHGLDVSPTNAHRLLSVGERHASPVAMTSHAPWPFDHAHSLAAARSTSSIRSTASASPAHGTAQLVSGASRCARTLWTSSTLLHPPRRSRTHLKWKPSRWNGRIARTGPRDGAWRYVTWTKEQLALSAPERWDAASPRSRQPLATT